MKKAKVTIVTILMIAGIIFLVYQGKALATATREGGAKDTLPSQMYVKDSNGAVQAASPSNPVPTTTPVNVVGSVTNLASSAANFTTSFTTAKTVTGILVHSSAAISQTVTATLISSLGAAYNTVLFSQTLSNNTDAECNDLFSVANGSQINVAVTNSGTPAANVAISVYSN